MDGEGEHQHPHAETRGCQCGIPRQTRKHQQCPLFGPDGVSLDRACEDLVDTEDPWPDPLGTNLFHGVLNNRIFGHDLKGTPDEEQQRDRGHNPS